jgi:hypothetical protein
MSRSPTWGDIKTSLALLDRASLTALIRDLYQADVRNRRFLHARFTPRHQSINEYRRVVRDLVFPDAFSEDPIRLRDATTIIREYHRATGDLSGTVELRLVFVEAGTEQALDLGYGDDAYFGAMERQVNEIVRDLDQLADIDRTAVVARVIRLGTQERNIGWGYGDFLADVAAALHRRFGRQRRRPQHTSDRLAKKPRR